MFGYINKKDVLKEIKFEMDCARDIYTDYERQADSVKNEAIKKCLLERAAEFRARYSTAKGLYDQIAKL